MQADINGIFELNPQKQERVEYFQNVPERYLSESPEVRVHKMFEKLQEFQNCCSKM